MSLISTNLVAGLLEASQLLSETEKALATPVDNIQVSFDMEDSLVSISASLPLITSSSASGIAIEVSDYAPVTDFDAGTVFSGGNAVTNAAAAVAIIAEQINRAEGVREAAGQPLPDGAGVGLTANFDNSVLNITAALPFTVALNAQGQPVITATNYLA